MRKLISKTIVIPQWQGGGQDLCTYYGAFALKENYLGDEQSVTVEVSTDDIGPVKNGIMGYDDILASVRSVNKVLEEQEPDKIFVFGGGCDADTPCAAYLNKKYGGNMVVVYIDSHGDLNTPESSPSKLYYGMSLRALTGDCAPEYIDQLAQTISPTQLVTCAGRNLDPEEIRFKEDNNVMDFTVQEIEENPESIAAQIKDKGYRHAYIHIDLDCLDPEEFCLMPLYEPDGLKCETLLKLVHEIRRRLDVVGLGILEYSGGKNDKNNHLIKELVKIGKKL